MPKLRFEADCENFDAYFARNIEGMGEYGKDQLPKELVFKLFRKGGGADARSTSKLGFLGKLFVLFKAIRKKWIIMVEDEGMGLSAEQFFRLKETMKRDGYSVEAAEGLVSTGTFVLAGKELFDGYARLNGLSLSPAYNYLVGAKNNKSSKIVEWGRQSQYLAKFISHYDGIRKRIVMNAGVTMPEWYTLTYLYDGQEKLCSKAYTEQYKYSYNASKSQIQRSFISLTARGFTEKKGYSKGATLKITAHGKSAVDEILKKYIIDF